MEVRLLGPLEVWAAGRPVPLAGVKQRAVLALLALQVNQVVSIDGLIDGLWGEAPPEGAVNTVQVYLSRLRKTLPADRSGGQAEVVVRRRPGYLLALDADQVDLYRFERLAGRVCRRLARRPGGRRPCWARRWSCGAGCHWRSSSTSRSPRPRFPG